MKLRNYSVTLPGHIYGLDRNPLRPRPAGDAGGSAANWWALGFTLLSLGIWEFTRHQTSSVRGRIRRNPSEDTSATVKLLHRSEGSAQPWPDGYQAIVRKYRGRSHNGWHKGESITLPSESAAEGFMREIKRRYPWMSVKFEWE